jgi:glucosamine-6-phosphate deaminase
MNCGWQSCPPMPSDMLLPWLTIPPAELGQGTGVKIRIGGDAVSIAEDFAETLKQEIIGANRAARRARFIIPIGPVDPYPILAQKLNHEKISCRNIVFIGMDEYLADNGDWIPEKHPLSFRGYLNRMFYDRLDPELAPPRDQRLFPGPDRLPYITEIIAEPGGVDACFAGIGINGHLAFNEPPEPGEEVSVEEFAKLPVRVLNLSRETRTINSVTVGGEISVVPRMAVTVGMKEILGARRLRLYCNRPWQSAVIRRVLPGPITAACPASLIRTHSDVTVTVADYVAAIPDIRLR